MVQVCCHGGWEDAGGVEVETIDRARNHVVMRVSVGWHAGDGLDWKQAPTSPHSE